MAIIGLLHRSVVDLRQGVGYPHRGEAKVPKWHPSGTPRFSIATSRRSYYSQQAIFLEFCFRTHRIRTPIV